MRYLLPGTCAASRADEVLRCPTLSRALCALAFLPVRCGPPHQGQGLEELVGMAGAQLGDSLADGESGGGLGVGWWWEGGRRPSRRMR